MNALTASVGHSMKRMKSKGEKLLGRTERDGTLPLLHSMGDVIGEGYRRESNTRHVFKSAPYLRVTKTLPFLPSSFACSPRGEAGRRDLGWLFIDTETNSQRGHTFEQRPLNRKWLSQGREVTIRTIANGGYLKRTYWFP